MRISSVFARTGNDEGRIAIISNPLVAQEKFSLFVDSRQFSLSSQRRVQRIREIKTKVF